MSAVPALTWEQYQQLPPGKRSRPLTPAEYAALTHAQKVSAGLEDDDQGAPADFNGPVFPNPDHVRPQLDTDPAMPVTRLPEGVSFQRGNYQGGAQPDVSNPATADVIPAMGHEVGAKMSAQPATPQQDWFAANAPKAAAAPASAAASAPTKDWFDQNAPKQNSNAPANQEEPGALEVNYPLTNHWWATASGLQSVGRGLRDAITGTAQVLDPRPKSDEEKALVDSDPRARAILPVYRILRSVGHTAQDATQIAGAMHDINQSPDPVGTYAKVAQETAGQGAGQAALALATEGAVKGAPALAEAAKTAGASETAAKVAASGKVIGASAEELPVVGSTIKAAKKLGQLREIWGEPKPATPKPVPELDATGENKPFAGGVDEPKPAKVLDATGENKPFAGGMDEAPAAKTPPKSAAPAEQSAAPTEEIPVVPRTARAAPAPRTIVRDPQTGAPEFSDVVAAKQQAATPAPVETKVAPAETPAPADELLDRLGKIADRIRRQETAAPGTADEDLIQQAQDSLDIVRARKATQSTPAPRQPESLDQFNQRLSAIADRKAAQGAGSAQPGVTGSGADLGSIFQRLVKGEAGQAGLPGSVTNADEGIADIQNRPVMATKTGQIPARNFLRTVGADENSVLKTQKDLDSVFYHRQQIAKNGTPNVELHVDEGNNVIGAQGRHRAIAAVQQGGPKATVNVTIFKHPFQASD
jgi:hypothetical protein